MYGALFSGMDKGLGESLWVRMTFRLPDEGEEVDASPLMNVRKPVDHRAWFLCRELHRPVTAECKQSRRFLEGVRTLRGLTTLTTRLITICYIHRYNIGHKDNPARCRPFHLT